MRIESVSAEAFGALRQQTLDLAPGMTVVYGRNETRKSTWHAAIYAAVCGLRRGKGARKEDRKFKKQRRPWTGDQWAVSCRLVLADNRRIEISRDLEGKVDDRVIDTELGRDVSTDIINDGAPDASIWLGLDRRSFLSTACIQQGDVLAVAENADELQERLEQAVSTAGTDATAARALDAIDMFFGNHVGLDRSNSKRPLRTAINGLESASRLLQVAETAHENYLGLDRAAHELERAAEKWAADATAAKASQQSRMIADLKAKVTRIRALSSSFPEGPPPTALQYDDLARRVTEATTRWKDLPALPDLSGDSSESLAVELASLPEPPDGDVAVASEVRDARDSYLIAIRQLESHTKPSSEESAEIHTDVSASELRSLAQALSAGSASSSMERPDVTSASSTAWKVAIGVGVVIAAAGLAIVITSSTVIGAVGTAVGIVLAGVGAALRGRSPAHHPSIEDIAREVRSQEARERHRAALRDVNTSGLSNDPSMLYQLADQVDRQNSAEANRATWGSQREELRVIVETEKHEFEAALTSRGITIEQSLLETFTSYEADCLTRAEAVIASARRSDLEARIKERRALEIREHKIRDRIKASKIDLRSMATAYDIDASEPLVIVESLEVLLVDQQELLDDHEHRIREWAEMEALLGEDSLADLDGRLRREEETFASHGYAEKDLESGDAETLNRQAIDLQGKATDAHRQADAARGRATERAAQIASVADAEEAFTRAGDELARVKRLEFLLTRTRTFLKNAEDKAHRDIAPRLKNDLERWLPMITEGRHAEVAIDVDTLEVLVRETNGWQPATLLSHGTAEQVYLLLRIAMVDHLVGDKGPCPLIIDDVTVQSDADRTVLILKMLQEISRDRQVVLFSQEEEVLRWAKQNLGEPRDQLVQLDDEGVPTTR